MTMTIDSLIFDLDGTLWNSEEGVCITWNGVLKKYPEIKRVLTVKDLEGCFGLPNREVGEKLFPELTEDFRAGLLEEFSEAEQVYLGEYGGMLYPELEDTLKMLSGQRRLFIVSNCQDGYIQSFFKAHKLEKYFADFECAGVTGLSKGENIQLIIERNQLANPVYVGDTSGDAEGAKLAGIPFIYARYGFGQVEDFDHVIDQFKDLCQLPILK